MMLELQEDGAHNINLVTPSHVAPWIIEAVGIARDQGLRLPLVYNSSGYDSLEELKLLDGIMDIYLPDMKYNDNAAAKMLSNAPDYVEKNRAAIKEMHRQVGDLANRRYRDRFARTDHPAPGFAGRLGRDRRGHAIHRRGNFPADRDQPDEPVFPGAPGA